MLLPNSEFCPDQLNIGLTNITRIQVTNRRFSNCRLSLDQFGNSITLVDMLEDSTQALIV